MQRGQFVLKLRGRHWHRLVKKYRVGKPKFWGDKSDKCTSVSRFWGRGPGLPPKSTPSEVVKPGFKTIGRGSYKFSKRRRVAQDLGHHTLNFYLIYTNLSISEKSPLWKLFSSLISVHYRI